MNRRTTGDDASSPARAELARRATAALEAVAGAADRELDRHAAGYGLSDAKLELLEVLGCCAERRACLYSVGDRLGVTRPNVTKLVDGLERTGLVERLPHPSDRRMVQAHLTAAGAELAERALPGRQEALTRLWSRLSDDQLAVLADLLDAAAGRDDEAVSGSRSPRSRGRRRRRRSAADG
jgi:DNA-binding MarR family transcriptional regulator